MVQRDSFPLLFTFSKIVCVCVCVCVYTCVCVRETDREAETFHSSLPTALPCFPIRAPWVVGLMEADFARETTSGTAGPKSVLSMKATPHQPFSPKGFSAFHESLGQGQAF